MTRLIVKLDRRYALWSQTVAAPLTDFMGKNELVKELRTHFRYDEPEIARLFRGFRADVSARAVQDNHAGDQGTRLTKDELLAEYSSS